jgi:hypothetical protein
MSSAPRLWLILAVVVIGVAPARAQRIVSGRVRDSARGTSALGAPVTLFGSNYQIEVLRPAEAFIGSTRPDGFWLDPGIVSSWPVVLVQADEADVGAPSGRLGLVAITTCACDTEFDLMPTSELVSIADPSALLVGRDAVVSWTPEPNCVPVDAVHGLPGHVLTRSPAGTDAFVEVARTTAPTETSLVDANVPAGSWDYALAIQLGTSFTGSGLSRRARLVIPDFDRDGIADAIDDCPQDADPAQRDADGDTIGDVCEPGQALLFVAKSQPPPALTFSWTRASAVSHDLYAHDIPPNLAASPQLWPDGWRDPARGILACDLPVGPSAVTITDATTASRSYLLSSVITSGASDLGNDSLGTPRARTTTLPPCR